MLLTTLIFAIVLAMVKSWGRIRDGRTPEVSNGDKFAVVSNLYPHTPINRT